MDKPGRKSSTERLSRRQFVRVTTAALGTAALARSVPGVWAQEPAVTPTPIPRRKFGNTDIEVGIVSIGTVTGPSAAIILRGLEWGINFLHTSNGYSGGKAIVQVAEAIKGKRDQFVIGLGSGSLAEDDVNKALQTLGTDHVDIVFCVCQKPDAVVPDLLDKFNRLKEAGKVRALGLTTHSAVDAVLQKAVDLGFVNVLMPRCNSANFNVLDPIVESGAKKGITGMAMKSQEGLQGKDYRPFWASLVAKPHWTTICKGPRTLQDIDDWGQFALKPQAYLDDAKLQRMVAQQHGATCLACGTCTRVCPNGVDACEILRYEMYALQYGEVGYAREQYAKLPAEKTATACRDCGTCTAACRGGLTVAERIRATHRLLT